MSIKNRVVWGEGLFVKPQHFQQMQRNIEHVVHQRVKGISNNCFGLTELQLNLDHLGFGKITVESASGVMPDGTPFCIPNHDLLPDSLEITSTKSGNQIVYLGILDQNNSSLEVSTEKGVSRYQIHEEYIKDLHSDAGDLYQLNVSPVQLKVMLGSDDRSAFNTIAIAKISEKSASGPVYLYDDFIPCHLNSMNFSVISLYLNELEGLVRTRSENIAKRIGSPSQGGVADVSDFMMLQVLNTMHGELQHLTQCTYLHPEDFYLFVVKSASNLMTFTSKERLTTRFDPYNHELPSDSLRSVMDALRRTLSTELELKAIPIPMIAKDHGLYIAPLYDKTLLKDAEFILVVKASLSNEDLRKHFVQQTKISSIEKIRDMISLQLPAIPLLPLPVTPRQLPYHADCIYFKLDRLNPSWTMLVNSSGFAFHAAGDFPDLKMSFWAIRE